MDDDALGKTLNTLRLPTQATVPQQPPRALALVWWRTGVSKHGTKAESSKLLATLRGSLSWSIGALTLNLLVVELLVDEAS